MRKPLEVPERFDQNKDLWFTICAVLTHCNVAVVLIERDKVQSHERWRANGLAVSPPCRAVRMNEASGKLSRHS